MSFFNRLSGLIALLCLPASAWFLRPTTFDLKLVQWDPVQRIFIASDSSNHAYSSLDGKNWSAYTGSRANGVQNIDEYKFPPSVTPSGYTLSPITVNKNSANQLTHNGAVVWKPMIADTVTGNVPRLGFLSGTPDRIVALGALSLNYFGTRINSYILSTANDVAWDTTQIETSSALDTAFWTGSMLVAVSGDATALSRDGKKWNFNFDYVPSPTNYLYTEQTCYKKKVSGKTIIKNIGIHSSGWGTDRWDPLLAMVQISDTSVTETKASPDYSFRMQDAICLPSFSLIVGRGSYAPVYKFMSGASTLSKVSEGFAEGITSICWNGSRFVAVGYKGLIATSANGADWERDMPVYHDTTLSGTQSDASFGVYGHITIQDAVIANELLVMPGTSFDMKESSSLSCQLLDAQGTQRDSILFSPIDKTKAFNGLKIKNGSVSYARVSGGPDNSIPIHTTGAVIFSNCRFGTGQNNAPAFFIDDGNTRITNSIVNGNSVTSAESGSSFSYQNTLFTDSTNFTTNGWQNNYPSLGYLRNCTIARGCQMNARTQYGTVSTGISSTNCAFMDSLGSIKADSTNHVYFTRCLSGESLFANPNAGDFHLLKNSPAIDSGIVETNDTMPSSADLEGNKRVFGRSIDIGAYEYGGPRIVVHATTHPKTAEPMIRIDGKTLIVSVIPPNYLSGISIFDAQGRLAEKYLDALPATKYHIPLSRLGNGSYYIRIETGLKSATYRF